MFPGLIWNEATRQELRDALELELAGLRARRQRVAQASSRRPLAVESPPLSSPRFAGFFAQPLAWAGLRGRWLGQLSMDAAASWDVTE